LPLIAPVNGSAHFALAISIAWMGATSQLLERVYSF
jgi:hypothetical protein